MKIWYISCETYCLYAVIYANSKQEAIEKTNTRNGYEHVITQENCIISEFTPESYNGVLIFL